MSAAWEDAGSKARPSAMETLNPAAKAKWHCARRAVEFGITAWLPSVLRRPQKRRNELMERIADRHVAANSIGNP
jgi:hypothetical protein